MPITPQDFVSKWKRADARERQSVQEHFIDLCNLVGHETPMQQDPSGTRFAFEMGAAKTSGGSGWADVAKLGFFGWEYKSKDADLDKAYEQLLRYRDALTKPAALDCFGHEQHHHPHELHQPCHADNYPDPRRPAHRRGTSRPSRRSSSTPNNSNRKRQSKASRRKPPSNSPRWRMSYASSARNRRQWRIS